MEKRRGSNDTDGGGKSTGKRKQVGEDYSAEFKGYVNVDLSDDQKAAFGEWVDGGGFAEYLPVIVADGVNVALKIDPKSGGFLASATQRRLGSVNAGLCVTARAKEPILALERVVFIIAYLDGGGAWEDTQPRANPDRW